MREIVLDTETTGFEPSEGHRIVEIGADPFNQAMQLRDRHDVATPPIVGKQVVAAHVLGALRLARLSPTVARCLFQSVGQRAIEVDAGHAVNDTPRLQVQFRVNQYLIVAERQIADRARPYFTAVRRFQAAAHQTGNDDDRMWCGVIKAVTVQLAEIGFSGHRNTGTQHQDLGNQ